MGERWPDARIEGIDSSPEMLERAREEPGRVRWLQADIAGWRPPEPPDLIYANAVLHWLPGHRELFPRLAGFLRQGGCLAVQMPRSWSLPSHRLMRETLADGGKGGRTLGSRELREKLAHDPVHDAEFYHDVLSGPGRSPEIWETEYLQVLEGENPVLEWVRSTGLRPVLHALAGDERRGFLEEYGRRLRDAYPPRADGNTIYPFRRLFVVAVV
jgi:trans-aconitate 2-methyltransferase